MASSIFQSINELSDSLAAGSRKMSVLLRSPGNFAEMPDEVIPAVFLRDEAECADAVGRYGQLHGSRLIPPVWKSRLRRARSLRNQLLADGSPTNTSFLRDRLLREMVYDSLEEADTSIPRKAGDEVVQILRLCNNWRVFRRLETLSGSPRSKTPIWREEWMAATVAISTRIDRRIAMLTQSTDTFSRCVHFHLVSYFRNLLMLRPANHITIPETVLSFAMARISTTLGGKVASQAERESKGMLSSVKERLESAINEVAGDVAALGYPVYVEELAEAPTGSAMIPAGCMALPSPSPGSAEEILLAFSSKNTALFDEVIRRVRIRLLHSPTIKVVVVFSDSWDAAAFEEDHAEELAAFTDRGTTFVFVVNGYPDTVLAIMKTKLSS